MDQRLERVLSAILTLAAVAIAVVLIRREFFVKAPAIAGAATEPEFIADWKSMLERGRLLGRSDALVHIVEFGDFECPFCARFQGSFSALREQYKDDVALTYIHYPLDNHRFALPAAHASECAARQGRFDVFAEMLFQRQDSLGTLPWVELARRSGVAEIESFSRCLEDTTALRLVNAGRLLAEKLKLRGTPTILVNGWMFPSPPTLAQLTDIADSVLAQRSQ